MKQKEIFGKGERLLYVGRDMNKKVLVACAQVGKKISEESAVRLSRAEAYRLGIQLLKLATDVVPQSGIKLDALREPATINVFQAINPDETPANAVFVLMEESDQARQLRADNGREPCFTIAGKDLERLIRALAKIV